MLDNPVMLATQAIRAAVIRLNAHPKDMPEVMDPAFPELLKALAAQGVAATGPVFSHFFKMTPELFEFEIGVPVAVDVQPTGRVEPGQLPEATVMQTIYYGPYEGLPAAWGRRDIRSWTNSGRSISMGRNQVQTLPPGALGSTDW